MYILRLLHDVTHTVNLTYSKHSTTDLHTQSKVRHARWDRNRGHKVVRFFMFCARRCAMDRLGLH